MKNHYGVSMKGETESIVMFTTLKARNDWLASDPQNRRPVRLNEYRKKHVMKEDLDRVYKI